MTQEIEVPIIDQVRFGREVAKSFEVKDSFDVEINKIQGLKSSQKKKVSRIEKRHEGFEGAKSTKEEWDDVGAYNLLGIVQPGHHIDYLAKLYELDATQYAAVKTKVAHIVGLGFDFVESHKAKKKVDKLSEKTKVEAFRRRLEGHKTDLYDWIDRCNEDDTFIETLNKVVTDYETTGNGYLEVGRTVFGEVGYLGHIPATTMRIRKNRDGFVQMVSNKAVFFKNFGDRSEGNPIGDDTPNEIIHFKKYSPTSGYYGVPDVVSAIPAIAGNKFASAFNLDYFENKAVPRYVIVIKGASLGAKAENDLIQFFEGIKGKNHRTMYIPLPADQDDKKVSFEMKPVEVGNQDSSFGDYRRSNISDILMANRVPITKVSNSEGMGLAAARDADKTFSSQVVEPEQMIIEKKLNKIVGERTDAFTLKLREMSLFDELTQAKIDQVYLMQSTIVPNEVRARWGMPAIEGGDKTVQQSTQEQAEKQAQATQSRTRDQVRSANATDSVGEGRNTKGEGRTTE